jgi:hypothetical protein
MKIPFRLLIFFFFYSPFSGLLSQISKEDSSFREQSLKNSINLYKSALKENLRLYYGNEYIRVSNGIKGTPFFRYDILQTGCVFYNGVLYDEVPLLYDIYQDAVVINDYTNSYPIKLVSEKIDYFKLNTHSFIRIISENTATSFNTGFYEVLFNNDKAMVLAKRIKKLFAGLRAEESQVFIQKDQIYIKKDNIFYLVMNKQRMLNIFSDKKEALKKYWNENNFNFKNDLEKAVIKTTNYYFQLSTQ